MNADLLEFPGPRPDRTAGAGGATPDGHAFERLVVPASGRRGVLLRRAHLLLQDCERIGRRLDGRRLVLTAAREEDLELPAAILREAFGDAVHVSATDAHCRVGPSGAQAPVLGVQVRCPPPDVERVRRDLQRRGGAIVEASAVRGAGVVRATAPAAALLGYARHLHELTQGGARHTTWLSHYEAMEPEPPRPA